MKKITLTAILFALFLVGCTDHSQELINTIKEAEKAKQNYNELQIRINPSEDGQIDDGEEPEPY